MQNVAANVRELRRARKLDQGELAKRAALSTQTVSNLEAERLRDVKASPLFALARALGVSPTELTFPGVRPCDVAN